MERREKEHEISMNRYNDNDTWHLITEKGGMTGREGDMHDKKKKR